MPTGIYFEKVDRVIFRSEKSNNFTELFYRTRNLWHTVNVPKVSVLNSLTVAILGKNGTTHPFAYALINSFHAYKRFLRDTSS